MIRVSIAQARKLKSYAQDRQTYALERVNGLKGELTYWAREVAEAQQLVRFLTDAIHAETTRRG